MHPSSASEKKALSDDGEQQQQQPPEEKVGTVTELDDLTVLGYKPELQRNRSMFTLLFQSLAIAAVSRLVQIQVQDYLLINTTTKIPYGFGGPLISAIYGGGTYQVSTANIPSTL